MKESKLLLVYKSIIRPTADYCSVVYNSLIPRYLSDNLERVQRHALKIIFGSSVDIGRIMESNEVETLLERRNEKCLEFAKKAAKSERFGPKWFIRNQCDRTARDTTRKPYLERFTRNERMRINPREYLVRLLNEQSVET